MGHDNDLTVSNYSGQTLTASERASIQNWFDTMSSVSQDGFSHCRNILLLSEENERLHTGQAANGCFQSSLSAIILYPAAFSGQEHRTGKVDNLRGTLTHEFCHQYMVNSGISDLSREWMALGGWRLNFAYPAPIQGRNEISEFEQYIETDYGQVSATEEFCDSGVKAIYNPAGFKDQAKREFILSRLFDFSNLAVAPTMMLPVRTPKIPDFPTAFSFIMASTDPASKD
jgi:hypothetical protein